MQLEACALALARGERQLFAGLSFTLPAGSALRVTGDNGSGKTSLLRVLCGLTRPDEGAVRWCGQDIGRGGSPFAGSVLYLGHADAVKHDLLAWEDLACGPLLGAANAQQQARAALDAAGLAAQADLPCRVLSQGQRKRVALARLHIAAAPLLWILDEPFSALDSQAGAALAMLLDRHRQRGGMLVYTTHEDDVMPRSATLHLGTGAHTAC